MSWLTTNNQGYLKVVDGTPVGVLHRASVYKSLNQSIPNTTLTLVSFNLESYDVGPMHDNAVNNSRLVAPVDGNYTIIGYANFASSGPPNSNERLFQIRKNAAGSGVGGVAVLAPTQPATTEPTTTGVAGSVDLDLLAGDYVEMFVFQAQGAAVNLNGGSPEVTVFSMRRNSA